MFNINTSVSDYISLVVTHNCNRKCAFCVDKYRNSGEFITMKNVEKAIAIAKDSNIKDILVVGGEPTLHPKIFNICKCIKASGLRVIMTTNYDYPEVVKNLIDNDCVDCLNISNYNQKLPIKDELNGDVTIHTLIRRNEIDSVKKLDKEIDKLSELGYHIKFSTLSPCNDFATRNQVFQFLNNLDCEYVVLFNEILGQIYRGCVIKRYDCVLNKFAKQSIKFHVDGNFSTSWERY